MLFLKSADALQGLVLCSVNVCRHTIYPQEVSEVKCDHRFLVTMFSSLQDAQQPCPPLLHWL